jgi:Protein of unknown function (DUF2844)
MKRRLRTLYFGFGIFISTLILAYASAAHAALGESADSIASDRKSLSAARGATINRDGYTIQTIESDAAKVREYISPSGVVFGIAWNGMSHPDLTRLLGSYAGEYHDALRQTPHKPGRRHLQVKTNSIVVEKWGHMRNLQGRAYVPSLIPQGVSVDEIK